MPTEADVVDQLSDYCRWLEMELSAPMHRRRAVETMRSTSPPPRLSGNVVALSEGRSPSPRRSRHVPSIAAAVLVLTGMIALAARDQPYEKGAIVPASPADTDALGSVVATELGRVFSDNWAPVNLPAGLVVWDVGWGANGGTYPVPFTEQLFGRYDSSNTTIETGLLIRIQGSVDEVLPGDSNARVTVRGTQGWVFNPDAGSGSISIEWVESGRQIAVQGRGVTLDEAVAALDALQWRTDGSTSFEPTSSQLALIDEASSGTEFGDDETTFSITDSDGPAPVTGPLGSQDSLTATNDVMVVQVGASVPGALAPELIFRGRRRVDGAVVSDGVMIEPGGRIIRVLGGDALAPTEEVLAAVGPVSGNRLMSLIDETNSRLVQLPEVTSGEFPEGKVSLRGGTSDWPLAICLTLNATERCRSVAGLHQFASWQNSVSIDGRWFIVGRQPATDPDPVVFPWTPETPVQFHLDRVLQPIEARLVGDQTLWMVEIPPGTDVVGVGQLNGETVTSSTPSGSPSSSALRRPDV